MPRKCTFNVAWSTHTHTLTQPHTGGLKFFVSFIVRRARSPPFVHSWAAAHVQDGLHSPSFIHSLLCPLSTFRRSPRRPTPHRYHCRYTASVFSCIYKYYTHTYIRVYTDGCSTLLYFSVSCVRFTRCILTYTHIHTCAIRTHTRALSASTHAQALGAVAAVVHSYIFFPTARCRRCT